MNRAQRKTQAEETVSILEKGWYLSKDRTEVDIKNEIEKAVKNTKYFKSEELENLTQKIKTDSNFNTNISITNEDSISCIIRLSKIEGRKIMCLNFASAKNPGGGFLNGSLAQEESLASSSALYVTQNSVFDFYTKHRNMKSGIYSDDMILSPDVPVFRSADGNLLENSVLCNFITSPAVNLGVVKSREADLVSQVPQIMSKRIEKMLSICVDRNYDTLILGAWGCGVFQNDPSTIAQLFNEQLNTKFKGTFKDVVFAIYSKKTIFIDAFTDTFDKN
ncbi:TIGR02452 family protein [uncultured Tenacibaculum sp.]|uniref:TIGR02452 family protein n=1 Tax=uncultured Tenacibaculum sp. TaxID=174713 RepID=UPI00261B3055|nr:TIGR02452 family protein [uncultured Tenacibaculum sp.]